MQPDRVGSLYLAWPMIRAGFLRAKPGIPILMYHSISDDAKTKGTVYFRLTTSPRRFREQMHWLHNAGYTAISLQEAVRRLRETPADVDRLVVVTFDDGFEDFGRNAWPVLAEFGFTSTMFLPTGFIGDDRKSFNGRPCLTWRDIRQLHESGVSFGAHTISHPMLYHLEWPDIRRELTESRERIENALASPVTAFAYPFAFPQEDRPFVRRFTRELHESGYTIGVTTVIGRAQAQSKALSLSRLPINDHDDYYLFMSKLAGAYDWMGGLQFTFKLTKRIATKRGRHVS